MVRSRRRREKTTGQPAPVPVAQSVKHVQSDEHAGNEIISAWGEPVSAPGECADARRREHPRCAVLGPGDEGVVESRAEVALACGVEEECEALGVGFVANNFFNYFQIFPENRPARFFLYMKEGTI